MQQSGEYRLGAPRTAVWEALNDPDVLARCIEGCQSMTRTAENAYAASVKAKIGPVSATFQADLSLTDLSPPASYTLVANVKGGAAGFGKGTARVNLTPDGDGTLLRYEVQGSVGGKLAQVGQRLVDAAARKMADDFFGKFGDEVAPGGSAKVAAAGAATTESKGRYVIWVIVFLVLVLAIVLAS
jgi:carbon monoxide dehydrogenase subunit G